MILGVGIFASAFLIAITCPTHGNVLDMDSDDDAEEDEDDENYEYKYSDFFEEAIKKEQSSLTSEEREKMKKNVITETTPNGNVVMTYYFNEKDPELSAFHYYCNDRSIPYKYLDTVARKFVITYECTELYLYLKTEMMKGIEKIKQDEENEKIAIQNNIAEDNLTSKNDSVFATFKNYKQEKPKTNKAKLRTLLVGKNRYTRLGNIEDYEVTLLPKTESELKKITFAEYKKTLMSY